MTPRSTGVSRKPKTLDRVYPLKITVFPQVSTGGVEVLVIMPAVGDKLGDR